MKTVENLEKISIMDANGKEIQGAIFNNAQELWDSEQKQLTLIFDPARVKTGLAAHESLGRALQPGKNYQLVIDGLESIHHQKMAKPFFKNIVVSEADLNPPDMNKWKVYTPNKNSLEELRIQFPEALDYLSLQQRVIVTNAKNIAISGNVNITKNETQWTFRPNQPWKTGNYKIQVNTRLEDPAGNNLNGLFDHKIGTLKDANEGTIKAIDFTL
ncbi:MAG: Ig-like domain-containing protein [Saprospiraceae bacterium]|nr:Ig-like domain-containing protein [Saprospiraceae bacterium]